jgi:PAS domain S-box-containing protein
VEKSQPKEINREQHRLLFQTMEVQVKSLWHYNAEKRIIKILKEQIKLLTFKFKAVFGSAHNHYILLDENLMITDFNHKAGLLIKRLFKKKMNAGESLLNYLHPDSAALVKANCKRALAGETFEVERRLDMKDKQPTWWLFQYSPAYDWDDSIRGVTFNARDITMQKTYEETLEKQRTKLREISLMESHDIRGPVCSIMGVMTIIKEGGYKADRQCLKFIETAANMLDQNTRNIVNYAQGIDD